MTANSAFALHTLADQPPSTGAVQSTKPLLDEGTLGWPATDRHGQARLLNIGYRLHGNANGPLRVALGGISASRQVQCWWRAQYGQGRALDPDRALILSIDWLDHPTGISTNDQADALARVLDHLDLAVVDDLIGASYGAMVGLAFAQRHSYRLRRLIAISGAHRSQPATQALRQIQRAVIKLGEAAGDPKRGVHWARALALTTYRPAALFDQRFDDVDPCVAGQSLESYLDHQGRTFSNDMSAARYCCLSESLDQHSVIPELIRCPVELIGVDSDRLVPLEQLRDLQSRLPGHARLHVLKSAFGHDAFLKEHSALASILQSLFNDLSLNDLPREFSRQEIANV